MVRASTLRRAPNLALYAKLVTNARLPRPRQLLMNSMPTSVMVSNVKSGQISSMSMQCVTKVITAHLTL